MHNKLKVEQHQALVMQYHHDGYHICYHNAKGNITIMCHIENNNYITIEEIKTEYGYKNKDMWKKPPTGVKFEDG